MINKQLDTIVKEISNNIVTIINTEEKLKPYNTFPELLDYILTDCPDINHISIMNDDLEVWVDTKTTRARANRTIEDQYFGDYEYDLIDKFFNIELMDYLNEFNCDVTKNVKRYIDMFIDHLNNFNNDIIFHVYNADIDFIRNCGPIVSFLNFKHKNHKNVSCESSIQLKDIGDIFNMIYYFDRDNTPQEIQIDELSNIIYTIENNQDIDNTQWNIISNTIMKSDIVNIPEEQIKYIYQNMFTNVELEHFAIQCL